MKNNLINLRIQKNENLDAQIKIFKHVAEYLGLMNNNLPEEEIHHDVDNLFFYDDSKLNKVTFGAFCDVLFELDIKIFLS